MDTKLVSLFASLLMVGLLGTAARADIIITGAPGQPGSITITHDLLYEGTNTGGATVILFDMLVPVNDGQSAVLCSPGLTSSANGGSPQVDGNTRLVDNLAVTVGEIDANDGYLVLGTALQVSPGSQITIPAQTLNIALFPAGFNPTAFGTFKGRSFLASDSGQRLSKSISVNSPTFFRERAVELYNYYAGIGQTNLGLSLFYENIGLSLYYFYLESGDAANAEFNRYYFKGQSLKYLYLSQGKPKLGRYFQFLNLAQAHKRYWILKGNPRKGQQLYVKYRTIALAARR